MKRAKVNYGPQLSRGPQRESLSESTDVDSVADGKVQEVSRIRTLENLKLALFFCRAQGRMARGEL
ncbi:hypothetical protein [Parapedobacter soli]|uniref:hypothetical protein n=1 Tax=Parapedobacter soli TaxID=416955 RepID=UPI0021C7A859|nr:hypothetical protein [Parapedobacter soli]